MTQTVTKTIVVLFCLTLVFTGQAGADDVYTSITTGRRMVVNHNIQQAKFRAEADALGTAVQNAFSSLLPGQILAANLDFFYDTILPKAKDYIITYKVMGGMENKGYYLVGVESKVDLALLAERLTRARILNASKDKPVLVLFITEQTPADVVPRSWWASDQPAQDTLSEGEISARLAADRFMVLGGRGQRPDPGFYNIRFNRLLDPAAAMALGRQMKADMVVLGQASASRASNRMGEDRAFNALIHLDAYDLESGEKALSSTVEAAVTSQTDAAGNQGALAKAARLSARDLADQLDAYWIEHLRKEHSFEVRIEGEKFHPRYLALTQRFKQMPGIENFQPSEMGADYAVLEMFYKGKPDQFANTLMLKTFEDFGFEFLEVSEERIRIQLIEKQGAPAEGPDDLDKPDQAPAAPPQ